jgi:pectinesterase
VKAGLLLLGALLGGSVAAQLRPQLDAAEAVRHEVRHYLGDWVPADAGAMRVAKADFVVDAQGSGTHRTVQAAVDAVPAAGADAGRRWVIHIRPGTYREPLCVLAKSPLLLRGESAESARIVEGRYNTLPKAARTPAHPCVPALDATTHGTSGSTSVAVFSDDVQLLQLSIANDASVPSQAVALTTAGDRVQLEAVQLWSHQDTLYTRRRERDRPARVFVRDSLIAGDVDFVFGNATLVITHSELRSRRHPARGPGGYVLAPSTLPDDPHGFLVTHSRFTAEPGLPPGSVALGRAWDQGVPAGTWRAGVSPNGQALVRESELGAHIGPWAASTSRRPVGAANRFAEHLNRPLASTP